jgi:very-short-patch-repair endonuclease
MEIIQTRTRFQRHLATGVVHRPRLLLPHHVTEVRGVPVTTIGRSVFDIAPRLRDERLDLLIDRIIAKSPGALAALRELLPELARRGRPGISAMRAQLAKRPKGYVPVASGLEMRFERICLEAGLPKMRRQVDKGGHEWIGRVDFSDELAILYEVDSVLHHTTPGDVARDEARDRALRAAGHPKIVRIREEDLWYHPDRVIEQVRAARGEVLGMVRGGLAPRTMPSS